MYSRTGKVGYLCSRPFSWMSSPFGMQRHDRVDDEPPPSPILSSSTLYIGKPSSVLFPRSTQAAYKSARAFGVQ